MNKKDKKMRAPHYIQSFKCIGAACEDTCCAGWNVFVDEKSYDKYKKVKNPILKARLNRELVQKRAHTRGDYVAKIKLKNGRCAFLSKEGLCDLYTHLGQGYLSDTCRTYPRTVNQINNALEYSLICSCPEAARVILLDQTSIAFIDVEDIADIFPLNFKITLDYCKPTKWQDYFLEIREVMIYILQNRKYTFDERMFILEHLMKKIDAYTNASLSKKISLLLNEYRQDKILIKLVKTRDTTDHTIGECMKVALQLKELKDNKKIKSKRYIACVEEMLTGLTLKDKSSYETYYLPFIKDKSYLLENYFVNYVFERCAPLDAKAPIESFERMRLYFLIIKAHLVGIACVKGAITEENVITCIQSLSKTFDHDDETFKKLKY